MAYGPWHGRNPSFPLETWLVPFAISHTFLGLGLWHVRDEFITGVDSELPLGQQKSVPESVNTLRKSFTIRIQVLVLVFGM